MTKAKWFVRSAGVLAIVAATAACGSSSNKQSSNSPAPTSGGNGPAATTPAPSGTPIKVGMICSCSGPISADAAADMDVIKAWANTVNGSGGLSGHPVDLITFDDQGVPGNSLADAQQLFADHVAVIVDNSIDDVTWANNASAAKIPVVAGVTDSLKFATDPDFYPSGQTLDNLTYSQVAILKEAGASSFGVLYCAETPTCAQEVPAMKSAAQQVGGITASYSNAVSATAPNYTAQCVTAQQKNVTAIAFEEQAQTFIAAAGDCDRQGYDPIYVAPSAAYYDKVSQSPGIEKNLWVEFGDVPYFSNAPEVQTMNAAVDKYYPGVRQSKNGVIWNQANVQTWTAGLLIRDAVKNSGVPASGTVDTTAMLKGLNSIKDDTLDGWSAPLTFTAGTPHAVDCWFVGHFVNGTATVENNGKPSCVGHSSGSAS